MKQYYATQKQKHKNTKQEHKMCKTNVKMNLYYVNIYKHEHENNTRRLWCKIMLKIDVEYIKRNEGSYFYLYPFGDLAQGRQMYPWVVSLGTSHLDFLGPIEL
jgi:hypothetical protein